MIAAGSDRDHTGIEDAKEAYKSESWKSTDYMAVFFMAKLT